MQSSPQLTGGKATVCRWSRPVVHGCAMQAAFISCKEARREDLGWGQAGLRCCRAKEEELGSLGGNWGWFLFICPRRVSHCVCCRCNTGFCPGSHWPPAASAPCHRPVWPGNLLQEGIRHPCPQETADWPAPGVAPGDPVGTSSSRGTGHPSGSSSGFQPVLDVPGPTWAFAPPSSHWHLKYTDRIGWSFWGEGHSRNN